jgi:AcrR family transcriptional regulator
VNQDGVLALGSGERGRLPRGRHGLPRELVSANQRERLLAATTALIAECGYAQLSVSDVTGRAAVSRATFYKYYEDKPDAVRAAQLRALEMFDRLLVTNCDAASDWPSGVAVGVRAALEFCRRSPAEARLLLASGPTALEPQLALAGNGLGPHLAQLLREGAGRHPGALSPSALSLEGAIGAAVSIVGSWFAAGKADSLDELSSDLTQILLTPFIEAGEVGAIARAA